MEFGNLQNGPRWNLALQGRIRDDPIYLVRQGSRGGRDRRRDLPWLPAGLMVFWFILGCSTELFKINQKLSCSLLCELCVLKSRASERVVNKKDERQLILTLGVLCAFA